jgi:glycosyltransferase involved in cell wall biosynthesis
VHALPDRFGPLSLIILDKAIAASPDSRILIQYVPQAFGLKAMNLPFCLWVLARRRRNIFVMFHEVALYEPDSLRIRDRILEAITRLMATILARAASRIFVSTASWKQMLEPMLRDAPSIHVLPVPSNVDVVNDEEAVRRIREGYVGSQGFLVGHFSAYPRNIRSQLAPIIPRLLADSRIKVVLLGSGSDDYWQLLRSSCQSSRQRLHATGALDSDQLSLHLGACDLMLQPYPDGITTRRSSSMAAIAHARAVVTTQGELTEPIWADSEAVCMVPVGEFGKLASAVSRLLDDPGERQRLGLSAAKLYQDRFDLRHTVSTLQV